MAWGLFGIEVLLVVLVFKIKARPIDIRRNYLDKHLSYNTTLATEANKGGFYVGVAVENDSLFHHVAGKHFNSVTPENATKWGHSVQKNRVTEYDFTTADSIVNFANEHGLRVRGHVLVWGRAIEGL